jgi:hypothetical protein
VAPKVGFRWHGIVTFTETFSTAFLKNGLIEIKTKEYHCVLSVLETDSDHRLLDILDSLKAL